MSPSTVSVLSMSMILISRSCMQAGNSRWLAVAVTVLSMFAMTPMAPMFGMFSLLAMLSTRAVTAMSVVPSFSIIVVSAMLLRSIIMMSTPPFVAVL